MATADWIHAFFDRHYVELLQAQTDPRRTRIEVGFLVRALSIEPPARVLDVACGFGRHSIELARRGFEVVGVDLSPAMLADARRRSKGMARLRFVREDMRRLRFREEFDAVINLFTSFGYFTHRGNLAALRRMAQALRPGGRLVIDTPDPAALRARISRGVGTDRLWWRVGSRYYVLEEIELNAERGVLHNEWRMLRRDGRRWRMIRKNFRLQLYDRLHWDEMLRACGLRRVAVYAGYGERARRTGSATYTIAQGKLPRSILVASRTRAGLK